MIVVLAIAVGLWGLGSALGVDLKARVAMLGVLYIAVIGLYLVLPAEHPMIASLGGSLGEWLVLGGIAAIVFGYRKLLGIIRTRAGSVEEARGEIETAQSGSFSGEELERYARHITLRDIGGPGQKRLKNAKVLVVGAGGLGSPVLYYLAAAGVGTIGVIDHDSVDLSNLQRQIIHTDADQGMPKVFSAEVRMKALNPNIEVRPYHRALTAENAETLFTEYDLVVDGTDGWDIRDIINQSAVAAKKPVISGAISAWEGQVTLYDPANGAPCMACIFPEAPAPGMAATCSETGVIGALPGVIGAMMAAEVIKEITRAGEGLRGRMLIYDALYTETRIITLKADKNCAICAQSQATE